MISFAISRQFQPTPLYHALLEQDHVRLPEPVSRTQTSEWRAQDVMSGDFTMIPPDASLATALKMVAGADARSFLVGSNGTFSGVITREQIERGLQEGRANARLYEFLVSDHSYVHPDHSLEIVIDRLGKSRGLLPVLSRSDTHQVVGVITAQTVIQFVQRDWQEGNRTATASRHETTHREPAA